MIATNIQKYKRRALKKKKDLSKFMRDLSHSKTRGLLKIAIAADKEVWKEVSCVSCANCCKTMTPTYSEKDVNRIAKHFKMTYEEFYKKWLKKDNNKDIVNKSVPCQFLGKDNLCTIYDIRPADCAEFPHFTKKDFKYQMQEKTYTNNMKHCPATLVFVEKMKEAIEAELN